MAISAEQEHYLSAILDKSEQDLLYEVASGSVQGITASARRPSPAERHAQLQRLLRRVPTGPITQYHKPGLEIHLGSARQAVQTARQQLYGLLCDPVTQQPNAFAQDFSTGQIKDIIVGIATVLLDHYNTAVAVGLPVAVLLLRNGLRSFCATKPTA